MQPIGNKSFIPRDQEVVCVPCYEENFAQRCFKCHGVREGEGVRVGVREGEVDGVSEDGG